MALPTQSEDVAQPTESKKEDANVTANDKPSKPLLKSRFRPNLSESDQQRGRLRRISGCESIGSPVPLGRVRTVSGSSDTSEATLSIPLRRPPNVQRLATIEDECQRATAAASPIPILRTRQNSENLPGD